MKRTLIKWVKRANCYCKTTWDAKGNQTQEWLSKEELENTQG